MANNCSNNSSNSCSPCTGCKEVISSDCVRYDGVGISGLTYDEDPTISQMIYALGALLIQTTAVANSLTSVAPSYTTTQRDALTPVPGQFIFNTSTNKGQMYGGGVWNDLF